MWMTQHLTIHDWLLKTGHHMHTHMTFFMRVKCESTGVLVDDRSCYANCVLNENDSVFAFTFWFMHHTYIHYGAFAFAIGTKRKEMKKKRTTNRKGYVLLIDVLIEVYIHMYTFCMKSMNFRYFQAHHYGFKSISIIMSVVEARAIYVGNFTIESMSSRQWAQTNE